MILVYNRIETSTSVSIENCEKQKSGKTLQRLPCLFACFKGGMSTRVYPGSPLCLTDIFIFSEIPIWATLKLEHHNHFHHLLSIEGPVARGRCSRPPSMPVQGFPPATHGAILWGMCIHWVALVPASLPMPAWLPAVCPCLGAWPGSICVLAPRLPANNKPWS